MTVNKKAGASWQPIEEFGTNFGTTEGDRTVGDRTLAACALIHNWRMRGDSGQCEKRMQKVRHSSLRGWIVGNSYLGITSKPVILPPLHETLFADLLQALL
jgi:hypothetical protein